LVPATRGTVTQAARAEKGLSLVRMRAPRQSELMPEPPDDPQSHVWPTGFWTGV